MTQARPADYWFSTYAIFIQLNATGDRNYIHANCSSGSMVMCYMRGIPGLGYDNAHNYRRWPLIASPTVFHDNLARYVYIAIPKSEDADAVAQVVFPSEMIDIYGCNESGTQVGPDTHYYIFTQGIISPSEVGGVVRNRTWQQVIDSGQLASDESIAAGGSDSWWEYIASSDMVKFLKTISEATFNKLTAAWASVKQLVLNGTELNSVASEGTKDNAEDAVVTPAFAQKKYLSRVSDDQAEGHITLKKGASFGNDKNASVDENGNSMWFSAIVKSLLRSEMFRNGFTGEGWKIWLEDGLAKMELDEITIRKAMHVFELIVERIRAVGGQIVVSAANGKIKDVQESTSGETYIIYFEENNFSKFDLIRCQTFTGNDIRSYWVEVQYSNGNAVRVLKSDFEEGVIPKVGDEVVLMGNTTDKNRQNLISISATEDGQPRIDVLNGVNSTNFDGCLRARLGNLDGISDPWFPLDNQPQGDGLYADNAYLRGTFQFSNGQDIATRFSIIDGKIESSIDALREDFVEEKGFLSNPAFNRGLESWIISDSAMLYETGQTCIIANSELLSSKPSGVALMYDESRKVIRIKNSTIKQENKDMRSTPEIVVDADGAGYPALVHFSVFVKILSDGVLTVGFENEVTEGFHDFAPFSQTITLQPTSDYTLVTLSGFWTGSGDFNFEFSGELYAYMFILTSDPVEAFTYRYKSLFEQSSRLTKLSQAIYDKNDSLLRETGLMIKPEGSGIYMQDANGKVALIGVGIEETLLDGSTKTVVKLTGDNIRLEGLVTANGNFVILYDGSVKTKNAQIEGYIYSNFTDIGVSDAKELGYNSNTGNTEFLLKTNIYVDASHRGVVLPVSSEYEGARVIIMDSYFRKVRTTMPPTTIRTENGSEIVSGFFKAHPSGSTTTYFADKIQIDCGTIELTLKNICSPDETGKKSTCELQWVMIGHSCADIIFDYDGNSYQITK